MKKLSSWTVADPSGEERTEEVIVKAANKDEAADLIRDILQDGNETDNFVVFDGVIAQYYGSSKFHGKMSDPTDEDLKNRRFWTYEEADAIWEPCWMEEF